MLEAENCYSDYEFIFRNLKIKKKLTERLRSVLKIKYLVHITRTLHWLQLRCTYPI